MLGGDHFVQHLCSIFVLPPINSDVLELFKPASSLRYKGCNFHLGAPFISTSTQKQQSGSYYTFCYALHAGLECLLCWRNITREGSCVTITHWMTSMHQICSTVWTCSRASISVWGKEGRQQCSESVCLGHSVFTTVGTLYTTSYLHEIHCPEKAFHENYYFTGFPSCNYLAQPLQFPPNCAYVHVVNYFRHVLFSCI